MDEARYLEYQNRKLLEHERLCRRCGSCCGLRDADPCEHLIPEPDGRYACDIYNERFGLRKTVSGRTIECVPIRNILHKTWWGRSGCAYLRKFFVLMVCLMQFLGCGGPKIANIDSSGTNIICFGNSITEGVGSTSGGDYPSLLSRRLGMPVINAGVSGDTTRDALSRIMADVLDRDPRVVVVEFSGNDFLRGVPRQETIGNLDRIVNMIQQRGAMVVLAGVGAGYYRDEYIRGLKQIAKRRRALLIPDIMRGILADPVLRSDELHPNDDGYRVIADRVYEAVKDLLD